MEELALFAPAGTPEPVLRRLNEEINRIIADTQIRDRLIQDGGDVTALSPEEFRAFAEREMTKYARVIEATGVKPE